ncbi:MAG: hypothetical protein WDM70_02015 [Nitrosomonadales bacterium]
MWTADSAPVVAPSQVQRQFENSPQHNGCVPVVLIVKAQHTGWKNSCLR